jgi:hypothetical protein
MPPGFDCLAPVPNCVDRVVTAKELVISASTGSGKVAIKSFVVSPIIKQSSQIERPNCFVLVLNCYGGGKSANWSALLIGESPIIEAIEAPIPDGTGKIPPGKRVLISALLIAESPITSAIDTAIADGTGAIEPGKRSLINTLDTMF